MEKTSIIARFKIYADDFSIDDVSNVLQKDPSDFTIKGQQGKFTVAKETSWNIYTPMSESLDVNQQLGELLSILRPKKVQLLELKDKYQLNYLFSIIIKIKNNQTPAIYFEHDIIEFAHDIKAEFDIDLYVS
ncbi:hypothetical protein VN24_03520 [Paenibacillus beijingensis]|uniref:DUF4279 domain-containing protein n=1 Tax=Paenibacillus beijingensis TaxID=1126833 RepID=A0A0D5NFU8_9BACL|nr:hypothetical protein VN24_03520 [Paenibacillus beijingensis]